MPALVILAAYPLAPPRWIAGLPFSEGPPPDGLTAGVGGLLKNSTAAAVSLHFGYALLAGLTALWLLRRHRLAPLVLLWPAFVFLLIVGTGNHYLLDVIVGSVCVGIGAVGAHYIHRGAPQVDVAPAPARTAAAGIAACALAAYAVAAMLAGRWPNTDPSPLLALPVAILMLQAARQALARRRLQFVGVRLALVALVTAGALAVGAAAATRPSPQIAGEDPITGKQFALSSFKGHVVVVNVWASWCTGCEYEADTSAASRRSIRTSGCSGSTTMTLAPRRGRSTGSGAGRGPSCSTRRASGGTP